MIKWILKSIEFFYSRIIYFDINKERMYCIVKKKERRVIWKKFQKRKRIIIRDTHLVVAI